MCGVVKDVFFIIFVMYVDIWLLLMVDVEVVEEKEGSYELIGNLSVYMLVFFVGLKDKVVGEVWDVFCKYNFF